MRCPTGAPGSCAAQVSQRGAHASDFFNSRGELRYVKRLRAWPLERVLAEKYDMPLAEVRHLRGR